MNSIETKIKRIIVGKVEPDEDLINSITNLLEKIPGLLSKRDFLEIEELLRLQRENAIFKETNAYDNSLIDPLLDFQQKIIMTRLRKKLLKRIRKLKKYAKKHNITQVKLWNLDNDILGQVWPIILIEEFSSKLSQLINKPFLIRLGIEWIIVSTVAQSHHC